MQPRIAIPAGLAGGAVEAFRRRDPAAPIVRFGGETMGTSWSVRAVAPRPGLKAALDASLARSIAALSQWEPDSALSRFNRAPVGEWFTLEPILRDVLTAALAVQAASGGAFDPAMGALTESWGFGANGRRSDLPSEAEIAHALARSGAAGIELDGDRARRTRDVALDLSGIGKGHAVDRLAAAVAGHGCADALVEIGGEFVGRGIRPDGQPWWIELENPPGIALPPLRVAAHGVAVATSGDYRRYLPGHAGRLGHTLDPRTGRPVGSDVVSVSVIAADCMTADAWATALTVLGPEAGLATAARAGLTARIVTSEGAERISPALAAMLDG